jgi:calcineurin-like phosphoesterase family protein
MKITLNKGQKLWFTSDTHFNHANICSATTTWNINNGPTGSNFREFKSLEAMNDRLVEGINASVGQDDILFHLGDWSFGGFDSIRQFRNRLVCKNIHLILGNHDQHIARNKDGVQEIFTSVHNVLDLVVKWNVGTPMQDEAKFMLMHFPIASWDNLARGVIHLHGHVHLPPHRRIGPGKMMDVGVDGNGLNPIILNDVLTLMKNQPIKSMMPNDHHEIVENYR